MDWAHAFNSWQNSPWRCRGGRPTGRRMRNRSGSRVAGLEYLRRQHHSGCGTMASRGLANTGGATSSGGTTTSAGGVTSTGGVATGGTTGMGGTTAVCQEGATQCSEGDLVSTQSDIFRGETSLLGDPRQHPWSDLFIVVKCENDVLPPRPHKGSVRTGLSLDRPPDPLKARKQPSRLD